jgi:cytochrome c peroxidase
MLILCCFVPALAQSDSITKTPLLTQLQVLGKKLFFDKSLSASGQVSCATCHQPQLMFSDGKPVGSVGDVLKGSRNTPSLLDVGAQRSLFWEGRRANLEDQALDPLLNPLEHGLASEKALVTVIKKNEAYVKAFREIASLSPNDIRPRDVAIALAAYEATLKSGENAFDRYLAGDSSAIEHSVRRGWLLFNGRAQCTRCHVAEGARPLFTDHQFHTVSVGLSRIEGRVASLSTQLAQLSKDDRLRDRKLVADADIAQLGRYLVTANPKDIGKFKTPGLRNVALTAPYMHDGSVATLRQAVEVEVYYRSAQEDLPLVLTPIEIDDLLSFLKSLSQAEIPTAAD